MITIMGSRKSRVHQYNIAEAKARLSHIVRKALAGDEIVIAKDAKPMVKLVPVTGKPREPGSAKGQVTIAPDFDRPLDDFKDYR
jgi:prevent-host-death family protein